MPRYFFSRMPSEKKYSPGASLVAASREPIITDRGGERTSSHSATLPVHSAVWKDVRAGPERNS